MFGISGRVIAGAGGNRNIPTFADVDVQAHIDRLSDRTDGIDFALNDLIVGLKSDGVWSHIDVLCVQHNTQADSLFDLTAQQDSATIAATWTSTGWDVMNTKRIDLQLLPANATNLGIENSHAIIYTNTDLDLSTATDSAILSASSGLFTNLIILGIGSAANTLGFTAWSLIKEGNITATAQSGFAGGSAIGKDLAMINEFGTITTTTTAQNSTGLPTLTFQLGGQSGSFPSGLATSASFTAWGVGDGLTLAQLTSYRTRIDTYMLAMGWQV